MRVIKQWTAVEDADLMLLMSEASSVSSGLSEASVMLERTESSCYNRYHSLKSGRAKAKKISLTTKQVAKGITDILQDYDRLKLENKDLHEEVKTMKKQISTLAQMEADYKDLLKIMDRARKAAFLATEVEDKPRFKMIDGSLERVDK